MAVNGIELAVGQVWRCRDGRERDIAGNDGDDVYPWLLLPAGSLTNDGKEWRDEDSGLDVIELVRDEHGFTIWRGGGQPEETRGTRVEVRFRAIDAENAVGGADGGNWRHTGGPADIVAYKIVENTANHQALADEFGVASTPITPDEHTLAADEHTLTADEHTLAAEMLSDLGYRWDGQTWVQEHQPVAPGALGEQVGGVHYKSLRIQPIEYIHANGIPFAEGSVIKYVSRWRAKNGIADLKKARHFLDLLIQLEERAQEGGAA